MTYTFGEDPILDELMWSDPPIEDLDDLDVFADICRSTFVYATAALGRELKALGEDVRDGLIELLHLNRTVAEEERPPS